MKREIIIFYNAYITVRVNYYWIKKTRNQRTAQYFNLKYEINKK